MILDTWKKHATRKTVSSWFFALHKECIMWKAWFNNLKLFLFTEFSWCRKVPTFMGFLKEHCLYCWKIHGLECTINNLLLNLAACLGILKLTETLAFSQRQQKRHSLDKIGKCFFRLHEVIVALLLWKKEWKKEINQTNFISFEERKRFKDPCYKRQGCKKNKNTISMKRRYTSVQN